MSGIPGTTIRTSTPRFAAMHTARVSSSLMIRYGVKMYSEESAVGELLRHNQMRCYYDDTISVIHQESSVTGKINQAKRFAAWRESLEYILKAFY